MCQDCGCSTNSEVRINRLDGVTGEVCSVNAGHDHHDRLFVLEQDVLEHNDILAEKMRGYFKGNSIFAINFVSSPGSGKTTLLEKTITGLADEMDFYVIEGDQQTLNDAQRINETGAPVVQINTGSGCHLDADMIHRAVHELEVPNHSVLMIENVGNLVCPAMFDLGETKRVVIVSVTEGEDKPAKYPLMFESSDLCIVNKVDLLPYLDFDMEKLKNHALSVNPDIQFVEHSAAHPQSEWFDWLRCHAIVANLSPNGE